MRLGWGRGKHVWFWLVHISSVSITFIPVEKVAIIRVAGCAATGLVVWEQVDGPTATFCAVHALYLRLVFFIVVAFVFALEEEPDK